MFLPFGLYSRQLSQLRCRPGVPGWPDAPSHASLAVSFEETNQTFNIRFPLVKLRQEPA
jgi:hypothetical protein